MIDTIYQTQYFLVSVFSKDNLTHILLLLFPFVLLVEMPFYIVLVTSIIKRWTKIYYRQTASRPYSPMVTVVITAYSEKESIYMTLDTLCEQLYPGYIEILVVIDDALKNHETVACVERYIKNSSIRENRKIVVIRKLTRGGLANSRNFGLKKSNGEIIMVIDADTSVENRCVAQIVKHFQDKNVIALSGVLRVRNFNENILCKIQAVEYKLGIELSRYGLSEMKVLNNISGAFGVFRVSVLRKIGGWLNGTAEDLDLIIRLHSYASRYPQLKIEYESKAIAYTNVPSNFKDFFHQRLRWEGDLYYIYVRRHWRSFSGKLMGVWRSIVTIWYGLYYQIMLPFIVLLYYLIVFITYNLGTVIGISILVYCYYLIVSIVFFLLYLMVISDTSFKELKYIPTLFLMPIFQMLYRVATAFFLINEIIFKGHKDTTMAPWWIIKRTK